MPLCNSPRLKFKPFVRLQWSLQEVYDTRGKGLVLSYRYDCERAAPTCIAAHPGEPVLAVGVDHNLLILEVSDLDFVTR